MTTATEVLNAARSQIGTQESPWGSNRVKYNNWYVNSGFADSSFLTAPWCAIFVSWCAAQSGADDIIPMHAYTPSGLSWFQSRGLVSRGASPKPGDVMYVNYAGSSETVGHVGFVESVLGNGQIQTIEGNTNTNGSATGYGVFRLRRTVSNRLYFAHPNYASGGSNMGVSVSDVIGKDRAGKPVTVGQALARGASAYDAIMQGGWLRVKVDRGENAYNALFENGWIGKRLGKLERGVETVLSSIKGKAGA